MNFIRTLTLAVLVSCFLLPSAIAFAANVPAGGNANVPAGGNPPAQTTAPAGTGQNVTLVNPLGSGTSLSSFLNSILALVVRIGTVVVILMLVYVGFLFVVAQGNDSKLQQARQALMWTVIGALILLGAQAIAAGIQATANALSVGS